MQPAGFEESGEQSAVDAALGDHPTIVPASRDGSLPERAELSEREELLAKIDRLEAELERSRAHAEQTSKLLLSATNYAAWVRERARRDAELALRKATARVEKLTETTRELEQTQRELFRLQEELVRLRALTDETRARLSAFLTEGLQVLNPHVENGRATRRGRAPAELDDTLRRQLPSNLFTQQRQVPSTPASEDVPREGVEPAEEH